VPYRQRNDGLMSCGVLSLAEVIEHVRAAAAGTPSSLDLAESLPISDAVTKLCQQAVE